MSNTKKQYHMIPKFGKQKGKHIASEDCVCNPTKKKGKAGTWFIHKSGSKSAGKWEIVEESDD